MLGHTPALFPQISSSWEASVSSTSIPESASLVPQGPSSFQGGLLLFLVMALRQHPYAFAAHTITDTRQL